MKTEEGGPKGELLPEPIAVALAQVAGASVQTGVLEAGVDGHSAVFSLRSRRERSVWLGRLSVAAMTKRPLWVPSILWDEVREMEALPGTSLLCDPEKARGSPCLWSLHSEEGRNAELRSLGPSFTTSQTSPAFRHPTL